LRQHTFRAVVNLIPTVASTVTVIVGCLVLVGWILNVDVLKRIVPGLVAMNPTTAVAFILAGVSLWLLRTQGADRTTRNIAQACAAVVAIVGLIKLVQLGFGWEFGIDQLLFPEKLELEARIAGTPNRMAPNTALNFFLVGSSLLLLDWQTHRGRWVRKQGSIAPSLGRR
jgi:prepilin signal peptidase PulO-like enzyme (type II secretory pathway)